MIEFFLGMITLGLANKAKDATDRAVRAYKRTAKDFEARGEEMSKAFYRLEDDPDVIWTDGNSFVCKNGDASLEPGCDCPAELRAWVAGRE